jgi:hypothetical protein
MADVGARAIAQVRKNIKDLLEGRYKKDKIEELADLLSKDNGRMIIPLRSKRPKALGCTFPQTCPLKYTAS